MRDFIKYIVATFVGLTAFAAFSAAGLFALLAILVASASQETTPRVERDSILTFDLSQPITDTTVPMTPGDVLGSALSDGSSSRPLALRSVLNSIEQAATDDRIIGLYLRGSTSLTGTDSGFATLREVREALQTFRDSGKPIYAYVGDAWQEQDYYLTSVANTIVQHPSGLLELNGFSSEGIFFAEALDRFGIGMQILRVGEYKSAVEPFIQNSRSSEDRQQTQQLLSDLWNEFLEVASENRDITPQQLQTIANQQAILLADQAETAGLIDRIAYEDEVIAELRELTGETEDADSFRQVSLSRYVETATRNPQRSSNHQIAIVYAQGNIVSGTSSGQSIGGTSLVETLRTIRQEEDVKAVVLRVNSPGGGATASEQIAREVQLLAEEKPVIASMGNYAASGGYQISTYANQIFASPGTVTGSIGVYGLLPNFQDVANENGISWDSVTTGEYADIGTISRPKTPEELAIVQRVVDQVYERFLTIVAESRNLPREQVAEIAQGRVWSGTEAQQIGLVDELGGLEDAIQAAASAADLGNDWQVEEYPKPASVWLETLFSSQLASSQNPIDPISLELLNLQEDLDALRSLNDPIGVYTRLPFGLRIR
ncbi:signal peptide peptidase SppA [filamentous cyanobacterium CCP2]|nr:signal peptide peptidase SppA [filamentous cyanobacterium CCP2]